MKTLITLFIVAATVVGSTIYYKKDLIHFLSANNYELVVRQFWINERNSFLDNKKSNLPFNEKVKTFRFVINGAELQQGAYYFDTLLYINDSQPLPIFTVVEPVRGQWKVNLKATFLTVSNASLSKFSLKYASALLTANKYITKDGLHGQTGEISLEHIKEIDQFIDEQFAVAKEAFKQRYLTSIGYKEVPKLKI